MRASKTRPANGYLVPIQFGSTGTLRPIWSMAVKDSPIAATALTRGLTPITHNQRDFVNAGAKIFDPFIET